MIYVIGGGISGLAVGHFLARRGVTVRVLEERPEVGGLAASLRLADGASADRCYHFACGGDTDLIELAQELGVGLHWRRTGMAYVIDGRSHPFSRGTDIVRFAPLSLTERLRLAAWAVQCRWLKDWRSLESSTARDWLVDCLGEHAYQVVWEPLLRVKFGAFTHRVSAPWMWHRVWRVSRSRRYLWSPERHGYFAGGTRPLLQALADDIESHGGQVTVNCRVDGLLLEGNRVSGVQVGKERWPAEAVVSTVPAPQLARLLPAEAAHLSAALEGIEYIGVTCVLLALDRPLSPCFWTNVSDTAVAFNGVIQYGNLEHPAPGKAWPLYIPFYCATDSDHYRMGDDELVGLCIDGLKSLNLDFSSTWVRESYVYRNPHAQPICPPGFATQLPAVRTQVGGLYMTDSTQLYPEDRNRSGMIRMARLATEALLVDRR